MDQCNALNKYKHACWFHDKHQYVGIISSSNCKANKQVFAISTNVTVFMLSIYVTWVNRRRKPLSIECKNFQTIMPVIFKCPFILNFKYLQQSNLWSEVTMMNLCMSCIYGSIYVGMNDFMSAFRLSLNIIDILNFQTFMIWLVLEKNKHLWKGTFIDLRKPAF